MVVTLDLKLRSDVCQHCEYFPVLLLVIQVGLSKYDERTAVEKCTLPGGAIQ